MGEPIPAEDGARTVYSTGSWEPLEIIKKRLLKAKLDP